MTSVMPEFALRLSRLTLFRRYRDVTVNSLSADVARYRELLDKRADPRRNRRVQSLLRKRGENGIVQRNTDNCTINM